MRDTAEYQNALGILSQILVKLEEKDEFPVEQDIVKARDQVLNRYQKIFNTQHIDRLTKEEFHSFLLFRNNQHWSGLHRYSPKMCKDMKGLREAIKILLYDGENIAERIDTATDMVFGMGIAVATAILLVAYPKKYGVWNSTSEEGLKSVDLWPKFERGETLGNKYKKVNEILNNLANDLNIDLWTLDALWWAIIGETSHKEIPDSIESIDDIEHHFGLERHLHEFLLDNWDKTELGKEWEIYCEEGKEEAGYEYPSGIGRIDILARHRKDPRWLIVELKREQTSDATVGQVLRYMGWVKSNLAETNDDVTGLVIARKADDKIKYALNMVEGVNLMLYEVKFYLRTTPKTP